MGEGSTTRRLPPPNSTRGPNSPHSLPGYAPAMLRRARRGRGPRCWCRGSQECRRRRPHRSRTRLTQGLERHRRAAGALALREGQPFTGEAGRRSRVKALCFPERFEQEGRKDGSVLGVSPFRSSDLPAQICLFSQSANCTSPPWRTERMCPRWRSRSRCRPSSPMPTRSP